MCMGSSSPAPMVPASPWGPNGPPQTIKQTDTTNTAASSQAAASKRAAAMRQGILSTIGAAGAGIGTGTGTTQNLTPTAFATGMKQVLGQ